MAERYPKTRLRRAILPRSEGQACRAPGQPLFALSRDSSWRAILRNSVIAAARHCVAEDGKTLRSLKS